MSRQANQAFSVVVLLFIAGAIGLLVYNDHKKTQQAKKKEEKAKLLFQLDSKLNPQDAKDRKKLIANVTSVSLINRTQPKGKQKILLTRDKTKRWLIGKPVKTPADDNEVGYLLRDLLQGKSDRVALEWGEKDKKPAKKFKEFGLTNPKHRVTFVHNKISYTLLLGKKNTFSGKFYAHIPGQRKILLVDASLQGSLNKKLFDLRRKELFTQHTKQLQTLSVTRAKDQLAFEKRVVALHAPLIKHKKGDHGHDHGHDHGKKELKKTEVRWYMTLPIRAWASTNEVNSLLSALKYLRASKFVSEDGKKDKAKYGLDKPRVILEVTLKDKTRMQLYISTKKVGKKTKAYATAAVGGPIAEISNYILKDLEKDAFHYRDTQIVKFKKPHVFSVRFGSGDNLRTLVKLVGKQGGWRIFAPSPQKANKSKVDQLFNNLARLKVKKFTKEDASADDLKAAGLDTPQRTYLLLGRTSKDKVAALYVGKKTKDGYYVTNKDKKQIGLAKAKDINQLPTLPWQVIPGGKPPKRAKPRKAPATRPAPARRAAPTTTRVPARRVTPTPTPRRTTPTPAPTTPELRRTVPAPRQAAPTTRKAATAPTPRRTAPAPAPTTAPAPR